MNSCAGKVVVITGASAGIGLATAQTLVQKGMVVIGLARRKEKMEESMKAVKGPGKFHAMECDVSSEEQVINVFAKIKKNFGSVHVLVNNAGIAKNGSMLDLEAKEMEQVIHVNVLGFLYCIKEAVKIMRDGDHEGLIVNVGSVVGHKLLVTDFMMNNVYGPTKFAVRALSENLQHELGKDTKIRVSHVSPGAVATEFFNAANVNVTAMQDQLTALESQDVADAISYIIHTKPHVQIAELTLRHLKDYFR